jgi:poly(3-hydroxybutyrate) depolymerase
LRILCRSSWLVLALSAVLVATAQGLQANSNPALDHAVRSFWESASEKDARSAAEEISNTGAEPDTILQRLSAGRVYSARVSKGRLNLEYRTSDGQNHRYTLVVPSTYDPAVPMPLRFYLHGRVDTENKNSGSLWDFERFPPGEGLAVYPSAWRGAMWWHQSQLDNILGILAELKRTYNIDENRIHVVGVSDGGTGAYFLAFKAPTPFAGFIPLIGHAGVLANPRQGALGPFYIPNLRNSPFFAVNGALDPLYPVREVAPYVALYRQAGVDFVFRPRAEAGHDLRWWPEVAGAVDSFIKAHPRNPFPERISWETESTERFNRVFWLTIDQMGHVKGETTFPPLDSITPPKPEPNLGVRADPTSAQGVRLLSVELGSLAGAAGLLAGDRITSANGRPTPTVPALLDASRGVSWGDSLLLTIQRDGITRRIRLVFGQPPDSTSPGRALAFPRPYPTGRVELEKRGNEVEVRTNGVRRYTLLLSPRQFNLDQPIKVVTNGKVSFEGMVRRSSDTLLEWAIRDRDRTMLYLAQLTITLN